MGPKPMANDPLTRFAKATNFHKSNKQIYQKINILLNESIDPRLMYCREKIRQTPQTKYQCLSCRSNGRNRKLDLYETIQTPLMNKEYPYSDRQSKRTIARSFCSSDKKRAKVCETPETKLLKSTRPSTPYNHQLDRGMLYKIIATIISDYQQGVIKKGELEETLVKLIYYGSGVGKQKIKSGKEGGHQRTLTRKSLKKNEGNPFRKIDLGCRKTANECSLKQNLFSDLNHSEPSKQLPVDGNMLLYAIYTKGVMNSSFLSCESENTTIQYYLVEYDCYDTSNSIKEVNQWISQQRKVMVMPLSYNVCLEEAMAIKIQRYWRQYRTKVILRNAIAIHLYNSLLSSLDLGSSQLGAEPKPSLEQLKVKKVVQEEQRRKPYLTESSLSSFFPNETIKNIKVVNNPSLKSLYSNKLSSSQVNKIDGYKNKSKSDSFSADLKDISGLIIENKATSSESEVNFDFKNTDIDGISESLTEKKTNLKLKEESYLDYLKYKLIAGKISKEYYDGEKKIIYIWFSNKCRYIKNVKKSLVNDYQKAKLLLSGNTYKEKRTNKGIRKIKCLSDKSFPLLRYRSNINSEKEEYLPNIREKYGQQRERKARKERLPTDVIPFKYSETKIHKFQVGYVEHLKPTLHRNSLQFSNNSSELVPNKYLYFNREYSPTICREPTNKTDLNYFCVYQKYDIFEFVFLDLLIYIKNYCKDNKVMRSIASYITYKNRLRAIPRGIKTSLARCYQYFRILCNYIITYKRQILSNFQYIMGPSAIEMLKYMHYQNDEEIIEYHENFAALPIIPNELFDELLKLPGNVLVLEKYYTDEKRYESRYNYLNQISRIFCKSLFECLNYFLDYERPFGIWGQPYPWKRVLQIYKVFTVQEQEAKLRRGIEKAVECCSFMCGIMADKEDSIFENQAVSYEYIEHLRENRLYKMLAYDVLESYSRWMFYDDEEAEILVELSRFVYRRLIEEATREIVRTR